MFVKRISLVVRTSYDVFVKPTYVLLKTNRTIFLCETGPRPYADNMYRKSTNVIMPLCKFQYADRVRSITLKPFEIFSRNLIQI